MTLPTSRSRLALFLTSSGAALAAALSAPSAHAQTTQPTASADGDRVLESVVVTGSRIRRETSDTTTDAPLTIVSSQTLTDRGYTQVGDALNQLTTNTASFPETPHDGSSSGSGQQFPNLFHLGAGRTLTLVNGRRFVNSGSSLGNTGAIVDTTVDTNMIPTGLLERVEVVQAGGSVVYGSDAIAGVVNYILKDHFQGIQLDAQSGQTFHGDYPQTSVRGTFGTDFLDHRGNIALNAEFAKTQPLLQSQRPGAATGYTAADSNPLDNGPTDGIPSVAGIANTHFWEFNNNGVLFVNPPGASYQAAFGGGFFVTGNGVHFPGGTPTQFNSAGTGLVPYNPGTFPTGTELVAPPFADGGDGLSYRDLGALYTGVQRHSVNIIGHYDLANNIKLSTELTYAHTTGDDPLATNVSNTVLNNEASGSGAIIIKASNPYLPADARSTIFNYLSTTFGGLGGAWLGGAPIPGFAVDLSKNWTNLVPNLAGITKTNTFRALFALDGTFSFASRDFDWNVSASRGHSTSSFNQYNMIVGNFANAIDAATDSSGSIVCAINKTTVVDPACAPINPFGNVPVSKAAQSYVTGVFGQDQRDTQDDYLATLGGPVVTLPAGPLKFSTTYEHRSEKADFNPTLDTSLGLNPGGALTSATSGSYRTNEISAELLVPLLGKDLTIPGVKALELTGAYRFVKNSLAGTASLWDTGVRWTVIDGLTLRATRSTNFRAPNLNEVYAAPITALNAVTTDPCDSRAINSGPNPAARAANCAAEFAAHPGYNAGNGLEGYQDPAQNFSTAAVTTGGNATLRNEVSHTWTYGFVLQPQFAPGLTIVADRIEIKLTDAISQFLPVDFLATCYDSTPPASAACRTFTRNANGDIETATSTYFNAGMQTYKGENYNVSYHFPLANFGQLDLTADVTHNDINDLSVTGTDRTRIAGTLVDPRWVSRFDAAYMFRALRITYSMYYLPRTRQLSTSTIENNPYPDVAANVQHSISAIYEVTSNFTVRAGIVNLTDEKPSYPTITYGDILGRRFFAGANFKY